VLAQARWARQEFTPSQVGGGGRRRVGRRPDVQQIVTHVFCRKGSLAGQGSVLLEVAGQPYFVLQGTVPAYRDLAPGETGEDVAQLQQDLISLGYGTGSDTLGSYGPGTAAAVSAYYQAHGYTAPVVTVGTKKHRAELAFIPLGDFSFVPSLPATVIKVGATVGKAPASGALTLALGSPKLTGQLSPSTAGWSGPACGHDHRFRRRPGPARRGGLGVAQHGLACVHLRRAVREDGHHPEPAAADVLVGQDVCWPSARPEPARCSRSPRPRCSPRPTARPTSARCPARTRSGSRCGSA
jgi:peptidoglycan hydrolase-like protein with peptidoglycan-binding domain